MYETSFSPKVIRPFHLDKDVLDYVLTFLKKKKETKCTAAIHRKRGVTHKVN